MGLHTPLLLTMYTIHALELDTPSVYVDLASDLQGWGMTNGCMVLMNSVFDPTSKPWFSLLRASVQGSS